MPCPICRRAACVCLAILISLSTLPPVEMHGTDAFAQWRPVPEPIHYPDPVPRTNWPTWMPAVSVVSTGSAGARSVSTGYADTSTRFRLAEPDSWHSS